MDRLIEWTGERCVPWTGDLQVVYEHYHRYLLAHPLVAGKRVLDLASGEGYGAALLAQTAVEVVGLEIDPPSVEHSRQTYPAGNLSFVEGSMLDLSRFPDGSFDVITCFEALEHVVEHDELVAGVLRVLAPDGVFLTSTPDRLIYSDELQQHNPHHVRELSLGEFRELISGVFPHVQYWGQAVVTGSVIRPVEPDATGRTDLVALRRQGEDWGQAEDYASTYYLAAASKQPLPDLPVQSVLVDVDLELVRSAQRRGFELADEVRQRDERASAQTAQLQELEGQLQALQEQLSEVRGELRQVLQSAEQHRHQSEQEQERLRDQLRTSLAETNAVAAAQARAERDARAAQAELQQLRGSIGMRVVGRYQRALDKAIPPGSTRRARYLSVVHGAAAAAGLRVGVTDLDVVPAPQRLPTSEAPDVSVVIPVHGQWDYTARCLSALALDLPRHAYEVIVVDDVSPDDTLQHVAEVAGIRTVALAENVGFLRACNAGIAAARGRHVVLLNNDTEPCAGWLDALVDTADADPSVGIVGAKLVYGDGTLQEAGGIIWQDGDGWNYGRGDDPDDPRYAFVRDVDYCSGAALLVRRELLKAVGGGFDERYTPAYYEDTDLCFAAREHGFRVVYQPKSVVVHHEGVSHGTDIARGIKRYQQVNRQTFLERWVEALREQHPHDARLVHLARSRASRGRILVVDHHVPTYDRDAGSVRMWALLRILRSEGYAVTFVPENKARMEPYASALMQEGIEVVYGHVDLEARLRELALGTVMAVLSRARVAADHLELVRRCMPGVPVVYDTVDLHHLREQRRAALEGDEALAAAAQRSRQQELGVVARADATLVVAEYERQAILQAMPWAQVHVVGLVHDMRADLPGPSGRSGLLFVGSFRHGPNVDAVTWFAREVLPLVRAQNPDVVLTVVGGDAGPEVLSLDGDGIRILGWVPDLRPLYDAARVVVAPLRYGAGIKGKVGEAMANGVPVVTTDVGAEGMDLIAGSDVLVADEPGEIAAAVQSLLHDDEHWNRLASAAWAAVTRAGVDAARASLAEVIDAVAGEHAAGGSSVG